jgi:hypothetical protein
MGRAAMGKVTSEISMSWEAAHSCGSTLVSSTVKEWAVQIAVAATALPCEAVDLVG